jgi:RNA polymerase-interacting CarD/CdnL/TRCF family regulator
MANLMFHIGDTVVHPQHGVGQVVKMEDREFERGKSRKYYEVSMPAGAIIWVPVDQRDSALRRVAGKSEIARCREILRSHPIPLTQDGRVRQSELVARLKDCTIATQCEVVRDLSAFVSHKPAYGTITSFLEGLQGALCQEWAVVEEISILEATIEISSLLQRPTQS